MHLKAVEPKVEDTRELLSLPTSKLGISFDDLYRKAQNIDALCEDFNVSHVSSNNMRMNPETGNIMYIPDGDSIRDMKLTRYAMSQLCTKIGVPVRYIEKCLESGMSDLAAENVNSWLSDYNKNLFIRECSDSIRGVLSDRYMTLDTPEILSAVSDVIDSSEYSTKGFFMSPERFHARIVQNEMMNIFGEDLFAGIQIDSSDVGRSTLMVRFMIFKQVCTNGLCVSRGGGVLYEQRHIGVNLKEFVSEFRESMKKIPLLVENSVELVEEARKVDKSYDVSAFDQKQMEDFVEKVKTKAHIPDESVTKVVNMMTEKYSPTRWGLINSLTEVAQDFTLEKRVEIEKYAGDLLVA